MKCKHPETQITAVPAYFSEDDVTVLAISVKCLACKVRFRFLGIDTELSPCTPGVQKDGLVVALPMVEIASREMVN